MRCFVSDQSRPPLQRTNNSPRVGVEISVDDLGLHLRLPDGIFLKQFPVRRMDTLLEKRLPLFRRDRFRNAEKLVHHGIAIQPDDLTIDMFNFPKTNARRA